MELFACGDYSAAIQILAPLCDNDNQAATVVARSCQFLGLNAMAARLFDKLGIDEKERVFETQAEKSSRASFIAPARATVEKSFVEDEEIWRSLSRR